MKATIINKIISQIEYITSGNAFYTDYTNRIHLDDDSIIFLRDEHYDYILRLLEDDTCDISFHIKNCYGEMLRIQSSVDDFKNWLISKDNGNG